jgi:hypothetical protein
MWMGRICKPFAAKENNDDERARSTHSVCYDGQILQTLCKGKNGHERARSTHSVSYAWMWMCRFCKPYAKEKMAMNERVPLTRSVMLGCGCADFANLMQRNKTNDEQASCFFFLACIFDFFPFC